MVQTAIIEVDSSAVPHHEVSSEIPDKQLQERKLLQHSYLSMRHLLRWSLLEASRKPIEGLWPEKKSKLM